MNCTTRGTSAWEGGKAFSGPNTRSNGSNARHQGQAGKKMKTRALGAMAAVLAIAAAGCATSERAMTDAEPIGGETPSTQSPAATPAPTPSPSRTREFTDLQLARMYCKKVADADGMRYVSVTDGGSSMLVDTKSEHGDVEGMVCMLSFVGTPKWVLSAMSSTTALQGVQTAKAKGYSYRWTYHPDNGFNLIVRN